MLFLKLIQTLRLLWLALCIDCTLQIIFVCCCCFFRRLVSFFAFCSSCVLLWFTYGCCQPYGFLQFYKSVGTFQFLRQTLFNHSLLTVAAYCCSSSCHQCYEDEFSQHGRRCCGNSVDRSNHHRVDVDLESIAENIILRNKRSEERETERRKEYNAYEESNQGNVNRN